MPSNISARLFTADVRGPSRSDIDQLRRHVRQVHERAAVRTVAAVAARGKAGIRQAFGGAGLGRLGNAIDARGEDRVQRDAGDRFSVSAQFFIRSRSERTLGAIKSYTEGSNVRPIRSRWLWIPTLEAQRVFGSGRNRQRLTPGLWRQAGLEAKVGPLIKIKSVNGLPLLAVQRVGVKLSGQRRTARKLTNKGLPGKGRMERPLVVMFVAIPWTSRAARVDITATLNGIRAQMPEIYSAELVKEER